MSDAVGTDIIDWSSALPEITRSSPPRDRLLEGQPEHVAKNFYADAGNRFFCGIWESSAGKWRVSYAEHEFCYLTKGRVRIVADTGREWIFDAGAAFVVPSGFVGSWEVLEPAAKFYAIYEPAP